MGGLRGGLMGGLMGVLMEGLMERCRSVCLVRREWCVRLLVLSVCASCGSLLAAMSTDMCLCKGGVPRACCPLGVTGLVWVLTF